MQQQKGGGGASGIKARLAQYQSTVQQKKDYKSHSLEVGTLAEEDKDINAFLKTPMRATEKVKITNELMGLKGNMSSSKGLNFCGLDDSESSAQDEVSLSPVKVRGSPMGRAGMRKPDLKSTYLKGGSQNGGGPGFRSPAAATGRKTQAAKDMEEREAKNQLAILLDKENPGSGGSSRVLGFGSVRKRYMEAVQKMQPTRINTNAPKDEQKKAIKAEAEKKKKYGSLKSAWDKYEDAAQDKPKDLSSEEEKKAQESIEKAEDEADNKWVRFAEIAAEVCGDDDVHDGDDDLDFWVKEAKRLKEEAAARRARKKKRKKKAEDDFWTEEAKKLRDAVRDGNGPNPYEDATEEGSATEGESSSNDVIGYSNSGDIGGEPQQDKDREERDSKTRLGELLDADVTPPREEATRIMPFTTVRKRYVEAVKKLQPVAISHKATWKEKKAFLEVEAKKKKKYGALKSAWDSYEDAAQDKPAASSEDEKKEQDEIERVEDQVDSKWVDFAETAAVALEEDDEAASTDDDLDFWVNEAKRLREEAAARRTKKKRKRKKAEEKSAEDEEEKKEDVAIVDGGVDNENTPEEEEDLATKDEEDVAAKEEETDAPNDAATDEKPEDDSSDNKADEDSSDKVEDESEKSDDDSDSESDSDSSDSKAKKKKGKDKKKKEKDKSKKDKDKSKKDKSKKDKDKSKKKDKKDKKKKKDEDDDPSMPRNLDGSLWRNPLRGWSNKPKKVMVKGTQISFKVTAKSDCWRKTRHSFVMDNAPYHWHKVSGDFEVMVKVSGELKDSYDKAGLQVRFDEENWIMSGMEIYNGMPHHSTCVTKDFTDWSLAPLPKGSEKSGIWFCLKRMGNIIESYYSIDCQNWVMTRQAAISDRPVVQVGICGACPTGENGDFKATFDYYRVKTI